jgi:general secretion pathway protein D
MKTIRILNTLPGAAAALILLALVISRSAAQAPPPVVTDQPATAAMATTAPLAPAAPVAEPPSAAPDGAGERQGRRGNRTGGNDEADQLRFNFKSVPLDTVLDYLSQAAGFVIVKLVDVEGRVDVVSHRDLTRDEAVELLNTVLNEQGYAAIRNERTLTIVSRDVARQRDIPVRTGNDPAQITKSDVMVTQIIPVKYTNAAELVTTLRELLPEYATLTANTGSNALVLTGTQTDVRRITEIVQALDQSIAAISALRVFRLTYADAKETADLITGIFQIDLTSSSSNRDRASQIQQFFSRMPGGGPPIFGGDRGGGDRGRSGGGEAAGDSTALKVASRVAAVSDSRTNSLVVSAPEEYMANIEELVAEIDQPTDMMTVVQVFTLQYADAETMAQLVNDVYGEQGQAGQAQSGGGPGFLFQRMMGGGGRSAGSRNTSLSQRQMAESTVLAVADTRTNSVVISAASDMMTEVAQTILELDQNPAKSRKVFVYSVKNAKPEDVTTLLQDIFGTETSGTNRSSANRGSTTNRSSRSNTANNQARSANTGTSRQGSNIGSR